MFILQFLLLLLPPLLLSKLFSVQIFKSRTKSSMLQNMTRYTMKQYRSHSVPVKGQHSLHPGLQDLILRGNLAFGGVWIVEDSAGNYRTKMPPQFSLPFYHFLFILDVARVVQSCVISCQALSLNTRHWPPSNTSNSSKQP